MKLTPLDIRRREFKRGMRGYADEEVDVFLDDVADEFERVFQENMELQDRIQRLDEQIADHVQLKNALEKTLVSAQLQADQMVANARKESELTLKDAELKARQIINASYVETQRVQQSLAQLKHLEEDFRFKFQSLLEGYIKLLNEASIAAQTGPAAAGEETPATEAEAQPEPELQPEAEAQAEPEPAAEAQAIAEVKTTEPVPPAPIPVTQMLPEMEDATEEQQVETGTPHVDESKPSIEAPAGSLHALVAEAERAVDEYGPLVEPAIIYGDPVSRIEPLPVVEAEPAPVLEVVRLDDTPTDETEIVFEEGEEEPDLGLADDRTLEQQKTPGQEFLFGKPTDAEDEFFGTEPPTTDKSREFEW